ncbi:MAG: type III polyketide synthase, partial [Planctomycetota bacterium]
THLVTVSCTGFMNPGLDLMLIEGLGFDRGIERTHVGFMGCHGFLNGLRVAKALAEADPDAVVVTCAVEICSLHYRYGWDQDGLVANALFADGAACVVGVGDRHRRATQPTGPDAAVTGTGSFVVPDSADAMTWHVRDYGFEMTLSAAVPDLIGENVRPWVESWLGKRGLTIGDIGSWAVHPGGPRILTATAEALGLPDDALDVSTEVLRTHGNMSSPTLMFVLDGLWRQGRPTPTVALGFGPGLAVEATLFGPRNA